MSDTRIGNFEIAGNDEGLYVDIQYPDVLNHKRFVKVGLCDVRAADDIRISYDKERDGWLIEQQVFVDFGDVALTAHPDGFSDLWEEVAFCPAWQLLKEQGDE